MKTFIYKTLFIFILLYIILHLTIGVATRNLQHKYQDGIENMKIKIRKEVNNALEKDKIFTDEDRELIKKLIIKIKKELN